MNKKRAGLALFILVGFLLSACGQSEPEKVLSLATAAPTTSRAATTSAAPTTTKAVTLAATKNPNQPAERVANNYTAPDFTLKSLEGDDVTLSQYRGKPVLLNFWATWCGPCKQELPLLQKVYEAYKDRLEIVGVDVKEEEPLVRLKAREVGLTYTNLLDSDSKITSNLYRFNAYPTSVFINKDGVIKAIVQGALAPEGVQSLLDRILS